MKICIMAFLFILICFFSYGAVNDWEEVSPSLVQSGTFVNNRWNALRYHANRKTSIIMDGYENDSIKTGIFSNAVFEINIDSLTVNLLKRCNWNYDNYTLEELPENETDPTPLPRHIYGGMAIDTGNNVLIMGGGARSCGWDCEQEHLDQTWVFSFDSLNWRYICETPMTYYYYSTSMVYNDFDSKFYWTLRSKDYLGTMVYGDTLWSTVGNGGNSECELVLNTNDSLIYMFGGGGPWQSDFKGTEACVYQNNSWVSLSPLLDSIRPGAAFIPDEDVFVVGEGSTVMIYDYHNDDWYYWITDNQPDICDNCLVYESHADRLLSLGGSMYDPKWYTAQLDLSTAVLIDSNGDTASIGDPPVCDTTIVYDTTQVIDSTYYDSLDITEFVCYDTTIIWWYEYDTTEIYDTTENVSCE